MRKKDKKGLSFINMACDNDSSLTATNFPNRLKMIFDCR